MKKAVLPFVAIGLLFAGLGGYFANTRLANNPNPAQAAAVANLFTSSLPNTGGKPQSLAQWSGKPLIVNFWATWCAPCVREMPELSALQSEIAPNGMQLIGIGIDSADNIAQFAEKYKIGYPLYVAGIDGSELSRQFGNQGGLPFTVLIGRDGQVKKTYLGMLEFKQLRADIYALMQ